VDARVPVTAGLLAWWESEYESEAKAVADKYPALPGDVIVSDDGSRAVVHHAELKRRVETHSCGCCARHRYDYEVWVGHPWEGPVEVIAKGGGTVHVMPVQPWPGDWPPKDAKVMRDGVTVYGPNQTEETER